MNKPIHNLPLSSVTDSSLKDYLSLAELITASAFESLEQELILQIITQDFKCDYCMQMHADDVGLMPLSTNHQAEIEIATRTSHNRMHALDIFLRHLISEQDRVLPSQIQAFLQAGFSQKNVMELSTALSMKAVSDYARHLPMES